MGSWLLVVEADEIDIGKKHALKPDEIVFIGRGDSATFRIRDKYISRYHCVLVTKGPYTIVADLGSENGVLVNGSPVEKHLLQDGDVIQLGTAELIYRSDEVKTLPYRERERAEEAAAEAAEEAAAEPVETPAPEGPGLEEEEQIAAPPQEAPAVTAGPAGRRVIRRVEPPAAEEPAEAGEEPEAETAPPPAPHVHRHAQHFDEEEAPARREITLPERPEAAAQEPRIVGVPPRKDSSPLMKAEVAYVREEEALDPDKTPPSGIFMKESLEEVDTGEESKGKILTAKCEDCRLVKKDILWRPGMRCPRCRSKKFFPVIVVDQEHQYRHAERGKGPAEVDRLLGSIAVWAGIVGMRQAQRCWREQEKMARQGRPVPPVDRLLTRLKYCTPEHVNALFEVLNFHSLRTGTVVQDEEHFYSLAIKHNWMSKKQADFLRGLQDETAASGRACAPVGWTAIERGVLSEPKVIALYVKQQETGRGLLFEIHRAMNLLGAPVPKRIPHSAIDRPWLGVSAAAVLIVVLGLNLLAVTGHVGAWVEKISVVRARPSVRGSAHIYCEACGQRAPETLHDPALRCPFCGEQAVGAVLRCNACGATTKIQPFKSSEDSGGVAPIPHCPKCGSEDVEMRLQPPTHRNL
jgi:hypothetical protein